MNGIDKLRNRRDTWVSVGIGYCAIILFIHYGHEGWLMYVQYRLLEDYAIDPVPDAFIHGIPTFIPFVAAIPLCFVFLYFFFDSYHCRDIILSYATSIILMTALLYTVQIVVYITVDIQIYLSTHSLDAVCYCHNDDSTSVIDLYYCRCQIPFVSVKETVITENFTDITDKTFQELGHTYEGPVETILVNDSSLASPEMNYGNTFKMLTLAQFSIITIILRFPLWILIVETASLNRIVNQLEDEVKTRNASVTDRSDSSKRIKRGKTKASKRFTKYYNKDETDENNARELLEKSRTALRTKIRTTLKVCAQGFLEGVDAFSLMGEFTNNTDYFVSNQMLTRVILSFLAINLVVANLTNLLTAYPGKKDLVYNITRIALVFCGNLPFFAIRSYLFWLYGSHGGMDVNINFLLFLFKEILVVLVTSVEVGVDAYVYKKGLSTAKKAKAESKA